MSLIFGLCLPRKIYLVSDSRLTSSDGSYKDDFSKWLDLNPRLAVIVANSAHQASWILHKIIKDIRPTTGWEWDFTDLEGYLRTNLQTYATEYYATTGLLSNSANFIFGGFERKRKLVVNAGRLGEAMAAPVKAAGEGVSVNQTADMTIINAFSEIINNAAKKGEEVPGKTMFAVDLPRPRVLAVSISAGKSGTEVNFENAKCYDGIVFNPNFKTERVELPTQLIGNLEYRDKSGEQGEATIYQDCARIISYTNDLVKQRGWTTVGGNILPLLILENASGFATGKLGTFNSDGTIVYGGLTQVDGKPYYYDESGKEQPYRFIYEYLDDTSKNNGSARLEIC